MSAQSPRFCPEHPETTPSCAISDQSLQTLQDLLKAIEIQQGCDSQVLSMLKATAGHFCMYFGKPPDRIAIGDLTELRPYFRVYFREHGFKNNSVRTYIYYLRFLLEKAKELGWRQYA